MHATNQHYDSSLSAAGFVPGSNSDSWFFSGAKGIVEVISSQSNLGTRTVWVRHDSGKDIKIGTAGIVRNLRKLAETAKMEVA